MVLILVYGAETCQFKIWYCRVGKGSSDWVLLEPEVQKASKHFGPSFF